MSFKISANEFDVQFMKEHGYVRKKCKRCGAYFWTVNEEAEFCGDSPCVDYKFIESPPTRKKYSLKEMRESFLRFFERNGHEIIKPYPVVARWRKDLLVTIASIVDFQPYVTEGIVEPPANPLVISQPCLRFEDLENVGFTFGRHMTIFEMGGAHAFNFPNKPEIYWKNETIGFHHEFATKELGIPEEYITYKEHFWSGGGNAGPDVEGSILGLEVSTLVFMSYKVLNKKLIPLPVKTVDTGYGIERWTWLSTGAYTAFEAIYEDVYDKLVRLADIKIDREILRENSIVSGGYTYDDVKRTHAIRAKVAKRLGMNIDELEAVLKPFEELCMVLDHSKALLFLISDGAIPSNVKEGYLSRLLFRRMFRILMKYNLEEELERLLKWQIDHWGRQFRKIKEMRDEIIDILLNEKEKYVKTVNRGIKRLERLINKYKKKMVTKIPLNDLIELYDSHGLHPEFIKEIAEKRGFSVEVPSNFFSIVAERHRREETKKVEEVEIKIGKRFKTKRLYYEDAYLRKFRAKVLYSDGKNVILDKTAFFPTGGGQKNDTGYLIFNGAKVRVVDVREVDGNIIHIVDGRAPKNGDIVMGMIDWDRRHSLMRNHTAAHIILGAARRVLGRHVWQAGAEKIPERARIDLTHHKRIDPEKLREIEKLANEVVMRNLPVEIMMMKRTIAEKKYGIDIYQGGVIPSGNIRIVKIGDWDVEACCGLHCKSTSELFFIKVLRSERVQDGVERIVFTTGNNALQAVQKLDRIVDEISKLVGEKEDELLNAIRRLKRERELAKEEVKRFKERYLLVMSEGLLKKAFEINKVKIVIYRAAEGLNLEDLMKMGKIINELDPSSIFIGYILRRGINGVVMLGADAISEGLNARRIGGIIASIAEGGAQGDKYFSRFGGRRPIDLKDFINEIVRNIS